MTSVIANALAMLAAKLLPPVFAFAVHVSVARLAGPETLGAYVHLLALLMIFQAMAGAGMQFLVTREIAAFPAQADAHVQQARAFGLLSGGLATIAYLAYAFWLLPPGERMPAMALSLTVLPSAWIALQEAIFVATRTHHWIAIVAIVENSLKMGIAVVGLLTGHGLLTICISIAIARVAALATGAWLLRRGRLPASWHMDFARLLPFVKAIVPFAMLFVLSMTYFRIDIAIVQAIGNSAITTGFYGAAATLFGAVLLLPESLMATAYPRLAARFHTSSDSYAQTTWLVAKLLCLALAGVAFGIICFADVMIGTVYGARFAASVPVLRLLALSLPFHALNGALGQALQARGEQRAMVGIVTTGVIAHVILNIVLVSTLGITGAAISMLISSGCVGLGAVIAIHRRVAPVRLTPAVFAALLPIVGPLVLATVAPPAYRWPVFLIGLVWIGIGSFWHGTLSKTEVTDVLAALGTRPAGAPA